MALGVLLGSAALLHTGLRQKTVTQLACADVVAGCASLDLRVSFDRVPQPMRPFRLRVEVVDAREVHASFVMQGMQMGLNRYRLLAAGKGAWQGDIILPVCVQGRGDWVMTLEVDGSLYQLPFVSG